MARALIVGCGCRGRELGAEIAARDWLVRGTARGRSGLEAIEAAGLDAALADPDRPGSVLEVCGDVTVVIWLLGSAEGESVGAVHDPRLERLLEKLVDTPVRGFVYEAAGSVEADLLRGGRSIVEHAAETWRIPVALLDRPRDEPGWARRAADTVTGLLAA